MLTCKQVSNALADGDYMDLPPFKRLLLRMHVSLCLVCHGFNRNIMVFQDLARMFRSKEEQLPFGPKLPDDTKRRIREAIQASKNKT